MHVSTHIWLKKHLFTAEIPEIRGFSLKDFYLLEERIIHHIQLFGVLPSIGHRIVINTKDGIEVFEVESIVNVNTYIFVVELKRYLL